MSKEIAADELVSLCSDPTTPVIATSAPYPGAVAVSDSDDEGRPILLCDAPDGDDHFVLPGCRGEGHFKTVLTREDGILRASIIDTDTNESVWTGIPTSQFASPEKTITETPNPSVSFTMTKKITKEQAIGILCNRNLLITITNEGKVHRVAPSKDFPVPGLQLLDDRAYPVVSAEELEGSDWEIRTLPGRLLLVCRRGRSTIMKATIYMSPTDGEFIDKLIKFSTK